ncbi:MAG: ribosomal 5S rRNA E-loop binding protein Ctc/L25/TL5, large subunit ribosomal protein L25 [Deltaproteobacteria bacterium CSP1-8]|nr:MAG: ribosomal 5S rRNA E-loop binding protein Ctc/L25/TL5, large subunit ribosomal protein L25 [Deltaproteobacteria bacterium CSP1-8]
MAMMELTAVRRHGSGKEGARKLLSRGKVPGIMYGKGLATRSIEFDRRDLEKFLSVARRGTVIVRMNVQDEAEAKESYAVLKDIQTNPRTDRVIHVDFYEVAFGKKFRIEVPIRIKGKAAGIEQGGIVEQVTRSLEVECLPANVPEFLEMDVTPLEIGDSLHLEDVKFPEGVQPVEKDMTTTIVSVHAPRVEEVVSAAPVEEAAAVEGASVAEPAEKEK